MLSLSVNGSSEWFYGSTQSKGGHKNIWFGKIQLEQVLTNQLYIGMTIPRKSPLPSWFLWFCSIGTRTTRPTSLHHRGRRCCSVSRSSFCSKPVMDAAHVAMASPAKLRCVWECSVLLVSLHIYCELLPDGLFTLPDSNTDSVSTANQMATLYYVEPLKFSYCT